MSSAEDVCLFKNFLANLPLFLIVSLTEVTSTLPECTHPFGQVLLPGQKES